MRNRIGQSTLLLVGMVAPGGLMFGQNIPEKFVVTGKAAEKIEDFTTINLATAQRLAETCEALVAPRGGGHTIIVLDHDGNHVYMDRMDGLGYTNIVTAEMKARTALLGRRPSKYYMNRLVKDPTEELSQVQLGLYPVAGGLPIVVNKQLIGAIGVGGFGPNPPVWSDEICAYNSLLQVIGPPVPPLLEDLPAHHASPSRFASATPPKSTLSSEFVVGGKGAAKIFDANQISLAAAKKIGLACRNWAASRGDTMSLYVVDNAGEMVHMERMDGQGPLDIRSALLKAQTSLRLRENTSHRGTEIKTAPHDPSRNSPLFGFFLDSGGIPIVVDGQMIGAVGVSGIESPLDTGNENCAVEGLKAAFGEHVTLPSPPAAESH